MPFEILEAVVSALFYQLFAAVVFPHRQPVVQCFITGLHHQPVVFCETYRGGVHLSEVFDVLISQAIAVLRMVILQFRIDILGFVLASFIK